MLEPYQSDRPSTIHGFECDKAAALAVERAVNDSHSTTAQHALDVIAFNAGPARVGSVRNSLGRDLRGPGARPCTGIGAITAEGPARGVRWTGCSFLDEQACRRLRRASIERGERER